MLGILGGMGPLATADFLTKLVQCTPAAHDQDHIPTLVWSCPDIPDRTAAILGRGPDPLPRMLAGIEKLRAAGASYLAIPCNTAHYWFDELSSAAEIPILHIVDSVIHEIDAQRASEVGLLATSGTVKTQLYQRRLESKSVSCRLPACQESIMEAITRLKGGEMSEPSAMLRAAALELLSAGCSQVILACTEIPLALAAHEAELGDRLIDATTSLARASVRYWWNASGHQGTAMPSGYRRSQKKELSLP